MRELLGCLLSPFMVTMFLAAACRHAAGFTWAYNCRLYFLSHFPAAEAAAATAFPLSAILGGAAAVTAGGGLADWLAGAGSGAQCQHTGYRGHNIQMSPLLPKFYFRIETRIYKTRTKLLVLGFAMVSLPLSIL